MRKWFPLMILVLGLVCASRLGAQQVCPGLPYVANTPEDELMQAVNGAETPQEQVAALDQFAQAHPDSRFMPCVEEYYTIVYLKLNDFAKVIEHGEKGLSGEYRDVMLMMNLVKAYVASGQASDKALETLLKASEQIKAEANPPRPSNVPDAEWQKAVEEQTEQANELLAYMEYAFFQILARVTDGKKRVEVLDRFVQAYSESKNVAQINFHYFLAAKMAGDTAKASEYGEKAVAADPSNVVTLNLVADDYVTRQVNLDKAAEYAKKALDLAPAMTKPEGMADEQFKAHQNQQMGWSHLTLGYVAYLKNAKTKRLGPAIQEFKTAADLLAASPELLGRTLFYLAYAYETIYPANHRGAIDALTRAVSVQSPWQAQAQDLLGKVRKAAEQ